MNEDAMQSDDDALAPEPVPPPVGTGPRGSAPTVEDDGSREPVPPPVRTGPRDPGPPSPHVPGAN